ncbi:MAG: C4-dicarboxylate ABC transporter [Proteobacteria bacterium SW_6_67_9]|nr:MAG: C4-dicarboxylate ABC transporter [Proteobacteria bacterium SW_6_67_9]
MSDLVLAAVLLLAALAGAPLFAVIGASALVGFWLAGIDPQAALIEVYRLTDMPVLVAIPLFTLAGYVLGESRAPQRLVRLSDALLGWLPGGLAVVALITCALFTAFTGASGITIVALGALLYPALQTAGYPERFSLGLVTSSGSLGILFAPSLPLILYGVIAQQLDLPISIGIDELFLAGLLPGLLMLAILVIAVSEAAAVAAVYVLVVEVAIQREVSPRDLPRVLSDAMKLVGAILIILGVSLASTNLLIDAQIPTRLFDAIQGVIHDRWTFLLVLNVFLLVLGTTLEIFSALVIMVPILLPIALGYGIDPLHLGIIFLANMQIGYFTPPVGMNLFIASFRFGKPILTLYRATLPFFFLLLAAVLLITYVPSLSLWLPRLVAAD